MKGWLFSLWVGICGCTLTKISDSNYTTCLQVAESPTAAWSLRESANGICMQYDNCARLFCVSTNELNLPAYTVAPTNVAQIQTALNFARQNNIPVVVKNSGHSYSGSSTRKDSLMIWMEKMPRYGDITPGWKDSCQPSSPGQAVMKIGGGAPWLHAYTKAEEAGYSIVGGGGKSVSAAGGWLMGGGLSALSRLHGLGIDNVVRFEVVTSNGTEVIADKCTNTDLFWALRGGGGGTFGIVVAAYYKVHPRSPVVFLVAGWAVQQVRYSFIDFWLDHSPDLDNRWGGYWTSRGLLLFFQGNRADANTTFINSLQGWIQQQPVASVGISVTEHESYVQAVGTHQQTDVTGQSNLDIFARLVPRSYIVSNRTAARELLRVWDAQEGALNYFLGGAIANVDESATAINPAMRRAVYNFIGSSTHPSADRVRELLPTTLTGACYNHASQVEPDWHEAFWADNIQRLEQIKAQVDPSGILNCYHCVGYKGADASSARTPSSTFCRPDQSCWPTQLAWNALATQLASAATGNTVAPTATTSPPTSSTVPSSGTVTPSASSTGVPTSSTPTTTSVDDDDDGSNCGVVAPIVVCGVLLVLLVVGILGWLVHKRMATPLPPGQNNYNDNAYEAAKANYSAADYDNGYAAQPQLYDYQAIHGYQQNPQQLFDAGGAVYGAQPPYYATGGQYY